MLFAQRCFGMGCLQSHSLGLPPLPPPPKNEKCYANQFIYVDKLKKPSAFRKKRPFSVAVNQRIYDRQQSTSSSAFERTWQTTEDTMFKFVCIASVWHNRWTLTDADTPELTLSCQTQKGTPRSELSSLSVLAVPSELSLLDLSQVRGLCTLHFLLSTTFPAHLKVILIP